MGALVAIAMTADKGSLDALVKSLDTKDEATREASIEGLKKLGAAEMLAKRVTDKKQPQRARQEAARALRFLRDDSTVPALIGALSDPAAKVRAEAALALSMFGAEQAATQLLVCLDDADKDVRYYAADALGAVRAPSVKAAREKRLLFEAEGTVKYALKTALAKQR
jgi:HEAT repeat protein